MPKGLRKFHFSFEKSGLTRFGGLSLFQSFCKSLGLRHFLQLYVRWPAYHHRQFHPADLFLAHLFAIIAGIGRVESTQSLIHNGLLPPLLGLPDFPHRDTLRSFLWRFDSMHLKHLQTAHDRLRHELCQRLGLLYSAIIDADTTALITYGSQEGTAVGYIPKRRHGQPSYAPIISSEGKSGLSLGMELRAGNVHPSSGAWDFLEQVLDKLPSSIACTRTRVRLDGAFYDKKIVQSLDARRLRYAIVARMYRPLKNRMVQARYRPFARGWEAAEFSYTPFNWKAEHRYVAVRRPAAMEPEEIQKRLFTFKNYTYHRALVTNLELSPEAVWRLYCDRAFQELLPRVQGFLCHGQNSHPQLLGQCYLHGDAPVGLRPGFGFPVSVFAERSSALEYFHTASRALVVARRMGQTWTQKYPLAPSTLSAATPVPEDPTGHCESQAAYLNRFATLLTASLSYESKN
jgi:hypothetical protein